MLRRCENGTGLHEAYVEIKVIINQTPYFKFYFDDFYEVRYGVKRAIQMPETIDPDGKDQVNIVIRPYKNNTVPDFVKIDGASRTLMVEPLEVKDIGR